MPLRLGLYGGTFDPIHLGHLIVAEFAREALNLDRVHFIPAGNPWQKADRDLTPAAERLELVRLAIADNPAFGVDTIELDTPGPSYSADTVQTIRARLRPEDQLFYLVGADSLANLHTWRDPDRLLANCTLVAPATPSRHPPPAPP
jgi:nicotinate-nucleotide adenylyltransferase